MMNTKITRCLARTLLIVLFFAFENFFSQYNGAVGINTSSPNTNSVLDIVSGNSNKGILIPRLTETQRNAIVINSANDDGLTVYNTTEDCLNYWSLADNEWKSVCGQIGKSVFTIDCSNTKAVGSYVKGKELTTSNYLSVTVNVTKIGNYTIMGTTTNGYNFYGTGVFLNTGIQTIQIPGQGTPAAIQTDTIQLSANGVDVTCTPPVTITVLSPAATYTMSCGKAIVNGVYKVGTPLTASNTITLPVNVTSLGSYTITTNTVDGISFSGSGTFTATGNQNITLQGTGTPTSTSVKTITITSDSQGGVSTTCTVSVVVVIPIKRLLAVGTSENVYGYNFSGTAASGRMISTASNFGTTATSIVKAEGFTRINGGNNPSIAQLQGWLSGSSPVDIMVIGYSWAPSDAEADIIADYLVKGGVVLAFSESNAGMQRLFRYVFNDNTITTGGVNAAGALYRLPVINDEIINGPFGDARGKTWGEDASATTYASGIPSSEIDIYSTDSDLSQASPGGTAGRVTAFKHKTLNFIWIGDGGFNSNCGASDTICPFEVNGSNLPVVKTSYGRGGDALDQDVYNSIISANAFAWAIKQAEFNGINTQ
ncbi:hypothetical protein [Chryseobacterium sp. EO14]|uniref:hypothetical protein n=1 Tax=Chryseobacterium sp. EO14 TaxID=2950551 RepID=UPI00210ED8CA|nr:hypothetical protein [Chryseobacterium sp. EO14]